MTDNNPYQAPETETTAVVNEHKFAVFPALVDIFVAPNKALEKVVKSGHGWWLPTILLTLFMSAPLIAYPLSMTSGEYVEMQIETMEAAGQEVTSDMVAGIQMTADFAVWFNAAGILFFPIMFVMTGLYYWLAGLVVAQERPKFSQAYNLGVWAGLPVIFSAIVQLLNIMFASGPLMQTELDPTTLSNLFGISTASYVGALAAAFNPFSIWGMVLAFIGFKHFNGGGSVSAVVVVFVLPIAFIAAISAIPSLLM